MNQESRNAQRPNTEQNHGRRDGEKNGKIKDGKIRRTFKAGQKLERWAGGRTSLYKDYKSGGSVITERLYIDIKQDFKKKKKKIGCVDGLMIYLTGEQLSTNAHQMEMIPAISSHHIQPRLCRSLSSSGALLGLASYQTC